MSTQEKNLRTKILKLLAAEFDTPVRDIEKVFFKSKDTMGLTEVGHRVLSKTFEFKQYQITGPLLAKHYLGLRNLSYPYYITDRWLILYNREDSTLLELYGSANDFLEANTHEFD